MSHYALWNKDADSPCKTAYDCTLHGDKETIAEQSVVYLQPEFTKKVPKFYLDDFSFHGDKALFSCASFFVPDKALLGEIIFFISRESASKAISWY